MDDLFYTKIDNYYDKFQRVFPTMEYSSLTKEEMIEKIEQCIKENKTIQELSPIEAPEDAIY